MTLREAFDNRVPRIRMPNWSDPKAYLRLPLLPNGMRGPWAELHAPIIPGINNKGFQSILLIYIDPDEQYEPYAGEPALSEQHPDAGRYEG